jgi:hypothetical protein
MKLIDIKQLNEGIFDFLKRKEKPKLLEPSRYPNRQHVDQWMTDLVEYYKSEFPKDVWRLFCPSVADYIPARVHAGLSREIMSKHLETYRELKLQNPDAVKEALKHVSGHSIYNGGPNEDYPK